jgi:hypothetical protein
MQCKDNQSFDADLLLRIFFEVDNFCTEFEAWYTLYVHRQSGVVISGKPPRKVRQPRLSASEIVTILIYYHHSGYKCFQYYYEALVMVDLKKEFPKLVSYNRFIEMIPRAQYHLLMYAQFLAHKAEQTGVYIIDSKKLPVCHNRRIPQHKTFDGVAARGKSSTGWFYGLKIHLIINHLGDIVRFKLTAANVADNNADLLAELFRKLKGKVVGDKGYLSTFFEVFYEQGVQLITKIRSNMKNKMMDMQDKLLLKKRPVIEAVNDILMSVCDIDHTRHRSPTNAFCNVWGAIIAYHYLPNKPSILLQKIMQG